LCKGYSVYAVGKHGGQVDGNPILQDVEDWKDIDTVTVYLNPINQLPYYSYLQELKPRRIIFNPGAENYELKKLLEKQGTEVLFACTLVMLSTGQY
jgi:predicted CoA-binding protein